MSIVLNPLLANEIIEHARQELPNECCGYVTGKDNVCNTVFKMTNVDASPVHFSFDPKEQFNVIKESRKVGEVPIVVYHSHPESPARLSNEDLRLLNDPNMVYLIVSLENNVPDLKAYKIINKEIISIKIQEEVFNVG